MPERLVVIQSVATVVEATLRRRPAPSPRHAVVAAPSTAASGRRRAARGRGA